MNLMMLLEMAAEGMGDRVAVVSGDERLTYGELFEASGRAAARLRASDADHLAILDTSSPALPVAVFAAAWAGKPFVPLNYRLTGDELDRLVEQILPGQLVTDGDRVESLAGRSGLEVIGRDEYLAGARGAGAESLEREWSMDPDEIAILLFTSGTTESE